ncbi:MAG TPA: SusC/RagA family TonB-linked outer membrane protein [Flavobacteriaceae bacterium]|nr:SusC/RagA family TonB-linked outer membrane protein [Flavobacteriaceae bacterium]
MKNNVFRSLLILCFVMLYSFSEAQSISGTVSDESGPLPGATVIVKGTTNGTTTDFDGKYSINVGNLENKLLVFSSLGYKTVSVKLNTDNQLVDMVLQEDLLSLDEVIITGTSGIATKKQLGSAITSITADDLSDSKAIVSVGEALQGQVAGAYISRNSGNPSGGMSIRLRGASTLSGSSDPLYIIDGVVVNNRSNQAIDLGGYTQNRLVDINPNDIERIEILKGAAAAAIYGSRASNGVVQIFTKKGKIGAPKITYTASVNVNKIRKNLPYNDAQLEWDANGVAVPATRYNYQDYIFTSGTGYENSLSINGGTEKTKYAFSGSLYKNEGIVRNTDFGRKTLRLRIDQELYSWLDLSVGSFISSNKSNDMPNGKNYGPITALIFADNTNDQDPDEFGNYPNIGLWMPSPRETIDRIDASQKNFRSISDIQLKLSPFEGFKVNYTFGFDHSNTEGLLFVPRGVNTRPNGRSEKATINSNMYNSDFNMSYQFDINDKIKSTTGFGYSYQYEKNEAFGVKNDQVGPIDGVIVTDPSNAIGGADFRSEASYWGGFLQQTFAYNDRIFLTIAGRIDGASTFGENERQQFYPKISASYNISDEYFWNNSLINTLKLRAAWGQAGNLTALSPYQIFTNYNQQNYNGNIGYFPSLLQGNENLKPERQTELEFGFDMAMFNNKLSLEFSYYNQEVEDLLIGRSLSPSTGFGNRFDNIGTMTNKGFELLLKAKPINGDFNWNVIATLSHNKNTVTHVEGGRLSLGMFGTSVAQTNEPIGSFYGTFFARDANGANLLDSNGFVQRARGHYEETVLSDGETVLVAVEDYDANGQPSGTLLKKIIGDPNPDFVASITNEFEYKNLGFRFQLDFIQGNDVMSWDKRMGYLFKGGQQTAQELNGDVPKGSSRPNFFIFESFIEDGSYIKLREVALFYNLKIDKPYLYNVKFTLSGTNLISFDNYYGFDPEVNTEGQSNGVRGQDMANVPIPQVYKFGVILNF